MTRTTHHWCSTLLVVSIYILAFQPGGALKKARKISLRVSSSTMFWFICYWARVFYLIRSYEVSLLYYEIASGGPTCIIDFGGNYLSILSVPQPIYRLRKIWSVHYPRLQTKSEDDNYNWAQTVYDLYWCSWTCYRQTRSCNQLFYSQLTKAQRYASIVLFCYSICPSL